MTVIATAGHVDHGKSTLVKVLTGTDPDRWDEEKRRGMTIDLGFASMTLPSGKKMSFIDVPGHSRFVGNMLSGVGSAEAFMFVVDANEGWRAQSEEHFRILQLLDVRRGVIAMTKVGGLEPELVAIAADEITGRVQRISSVDLPVVPVDATAGIGLDELRTALDRLVAELPSANDDARARLWVDRSFSLRGVGTVVTGTLLGGSLSIGDEVAIEPVGRRARIRSLQNHNQPCESVGPINRVAVNLIGIEVSHVRRGTALVHPGQWHMTSVLDVSLTALESVPQSITSRGAFAIYLGTARVSVRLKMLGRRQRIAPGETGEARLWVMADQGVVAVPGDRFVLREFGRDTTLGGGVILDVAPVLSPSKARPSMSVERVIEERGWVLAEELERLTGERVDPTVDSWVVAPGAEADAISHIVDLCRSCGSDGLELARFSDVELALLRRGVDGVVISGPNVYLESLLRRGLSDQASELLALLDKEVLSPPEIPLANRRGLRELEAAGLAIQAGDIWFAVSAVERAKDRLRDLMNSRPQGFTVSEARQLLGISRKYALPLLEYFDAKGVTRRRGDVRVAGARIGQGAEKARLSRIEQ